MPAPLAGSLLLVQPQGLGLLDTYHVATTITAADDPLVRGALLAVALALGVAWVATRSGQLRLDLKVLAGLGAGRYVFEAQVRRAGRHLEPGSCARHRHSAG